MLQRNRHVWRLGAVAKKNRNKNSERQFRDLISQKQVAFLPISNHITKGATMKDGEKGKG